MATEIFARMTALVQTHARDTDSKAEKVYNYAGEDDEDDDDDDDDVGDDDDVSLGHWLQ